jgi:hypothetical protein
MKGSEAMKKVLVLAIAAFFLPVANAQTDQKLFNGLVATLCPHLTNNEFHVGRGLIDYGYHLSHTAGSSFFDRLVQLPNGARWIDMGAGNLNAMSDALEFRALAAKNFHMTAVNYRNPEYLEKRLATGELSEIEILHGDYLENMYQHGKLNHLKGKADLITDVVGVMSYTEHFSEVMKIYSELLKVGGKLEFSMVLAKREQRNFELVSKMRPDDLGTPQQDGFLFDKEAPKDASIRHYLKQMKGLEVTHSRTFDNDGELIFTAELKKTQERVMIPDLDATEYNPHSAPPTRKFSFRHSG